ncbi:MAG: hypothetical protein KAH54_07175 [Candidatus Sabulitectum sp.]|nr:hypothetical protein [Candidatus Sabulitectum sp.]
MKYLLTTALLLSLLACGKAEPSTTNSVVTPAVTDVPMLHIAARIGVELGDSNFVFGVIQGVDFTPTGDVVILDGQKKIVRVFSPSGDFLGDLGGEGEAPGEFLSPRGIACLDDGRIAVTDPFSREVEVFDGSLLHLETISDFTGRAPFVITGAGSGFAGEQGGFNRNEGVVTTSVALWEDIYEGPTMHVFYEIEDSFSPENMIERFMKPQAGLAADRTNIYYSAPVSEEYSVSVFPLDGSEAYTLGFPDYSPVAKSEEDIQEDITAYEYRLQAMAASGRGGRLAGATYNPPSHYYATGSIGVDSEGNIWVQRGWESNPAFDLFPPGATEPAETVIADPELNLSGHTFVITDRGIAAYDPNPENYPQVLILHLTE